MILNDNCPLDILIQINGKRNMGLLIAVYVVFTTSMTTAFLIMWPGTIMWAEVGLTTDISFSSERDRKKICKYQPTNPSPSPILQGNPPLLQLSLKLTAQQDQSYEIKTRLSKPR